MTDTSPGIRHWLLRDLPYAAMLVLALGGLVLTSFRGSAMYYYWMVLAPVYGERLYFGRTEGGRSRPFVLPWAAR